MREKVPRGDRDDGVVVVVVVVVVYNDKCGWLILGSVPINLTGRGDILTERIDILTGRGDILTG